MRAVRGKLLALVLAAAAAAGVLAAVKPSAGQSPARRKSAGSAAGAVNTWNHWKKGVPARKFNVKAKRDEGLPWTVDDAKKLDPKLASYGGCEFILQTYQVLKARYGAQRALDWYQWLLHRKTKLFGGSKHDRIHLWNFYGFNAFNALDHGRVLEAVEGLKRCGAKPSWYFAGRGVPSIKLFEDLRTFPRDPDSIVFPKENVWVKGRRTVHARDYGWNPTDATDAIVKALADPKADVVVLDKMETPWLVTHVDIPSNKTLVFEDGVRLHATVAEQKANSRKGLFTLKDVQNVALIGRGDARIGVYPDFETRKRYINGEGGTGIYILGTKNILIRDLTVSECGCDGLTVGGCGRFNEEIYVENVSFDRNSRQGVSMCNGSNVYMKNVKFLNTVGAQPMAGIDFEPSIQEVEATSNIYLIDCEFRGNAGMDIAFSESSTYPVTVLFKNCVIGPRNYPSVYITALCGLYQGNGTDAPSDIIFDGCTFKGVSWYPVVEIGNANLFHLTFRDCDVVETTGRPTGASPFMFRLDREFYNPVNDDRTWYAKEGSVAFDNVRINGWKGGDPLCFNDRTGHYSVNRVFGRVSMNGRPVDMTKFRYEAPDFKYREPGNVEASALTAPPADEPRMKGAPGVKFCKGAPWWVGGLKYEVYTPSGSGYTSQTLDHAAAAGRLNSNREAVFATRCSDRLVRLESPSTVYFEVPAGKGDAVVKIVEVGQAELLKGRDKVVETYTAASLRNGFTHIPVKLGQKPQVYGLRATRGNLVFKTFEPCTGIYATDPAALPAVAPKETADLKPRR